MGKLPDITAPQFDWGVENCLDKYFVRLKNTLYCLECGHSWNNSTHLVTSIAGVTCPECGKELKQCTSYQRHYREAAYFAVLTTIEDFQVVRMVFVEKNNKKRRAPKVITSEVMQHWIGIDGKMVHASRGINGLGSIYFDNWAFGTDIEIKGTHSTNSSARFSLKPYKVYPEKKILKVIRRNGFKGAFHEFAPHTLFSLILTDTYAETLLKSGQISLLRHCGNYTYESRRLINNWSSVKICIRNGYKVKDASSWFDYLNLLHFFGKDLHNPKYVCPADFSKAHSKLVAKKRDYDKKIEIKELRAKSEKQQEKYFKARSKFFGLNFTDGHISIKVLESVEEFMIEGETLKHCVFTNKYFERNESLIMSARIEDKPVETIEVNLNSLTVSQARGMNNKPTKYHNEIVSLITSNLPKVQKIITKSVSL